MPPSPPGLTRKLGFRVALHTAAIFPRRLATLLDDIDWLGLDVKAPFDHYSAITGSPAGGHRASESLDLVLEAASSGRLDYDVRTTFHPRLLGESDLMAMARDLATRGVRRYVLQRFRPQGCADDGLRVGGRVELGAATRRRLELMFEEFVVR